MAQVVWTLCNKFTQEFLASVIHFFPWAEDVQQLAAAVEHWRRPEWERAAHKSQEALELVVAGQHDAVLACGWGFLQGADFARYYALVSTRSRAAFWDTLLPALRVQFLHEIVRAEVWERVAAVFATRATCITQDWKSSLVKLARDPAFVADVLSALPPSAELSSLLSSSLPLVRSFSAPRYTAPVQETVVGLSKSAKRRARRERQTEQRKQAESSQFAPLVAELEKVVEEGVDEAELDEMLECVRSCVDCARAEDRPLGVADFWLVMEKVTQGEPIPQEFKQVVSSIFETGGLDLANPMGLFEKLANSLQLDARDRRQVQQQVAGLQRALSSGDASGLEALLQQTLGSAAGFDVGSFSSLLGSRVRQ